MFVSLSLGRTLEMIDETMKILKKWVEKLRFENGKQLNSQ